MIRRGFAVASIAVTGLGFVAGAVASYPGSDTGAVTTVLVALGAVMGLAIVGGAAYLYRSDVRTSHTLRIAGWNLLGVALLGLIIVLATTAEGVSIPGYVVVDVLGVSSVAHLLIGYNDVRRIRAQELARQRRTLSVVNRLTRHNLRNRTQVLTANASLLVESDDDDENRDVAETVRDTASDLADIHGELETIQRALNDTPPSDSVDLRDVVDGVVASYREDRPEGTFEVAVPDGLAVRGDEQLVAAVDHLVENAVTHGSPEEVFVRVAAERDGDTVTLSVTDRGPGIPETETAILSDEREETQLEHGSGLGLWVVKTVAERYGGSLGFDTDGKGTTARLRVGTA
jgi:signal transduction histidine kinase